MIEELVWREHNVEKLREHGISRREVRDLVFVQDSNTVDRQPRYPHQVRITGTTSAGRWLTIALEELGAGRYRRVTGWDATEAEREDHREKAP